jgi:dTDP-4-dehydrorhamnose reductase
MSSTGQTTWYGFARAIVGDVDSPRIEPITTAEYPLPARRPAYGVLDTRRFAQTFGHALPTWAQALHACMTSPAEPPTPISAA